MIGDLSGLREGISAVAIVVGVFALVGSASSCAGEPNADPSTIEDEELTQVPGVPAAAIETGEPRPTSEATASQYSLQSQDIFSALLRRLTCPQERYHFLC